MDLTPRLLTEVEFREEWRGYKREDVDDFLARVAAAIGDLQERAREASERAAQAERRLLERSDEDEIRRTLVLAQRTALSAVEEAQAEAERVLLDANERARRQVSEAEARLAAVDEEVAQRTRRDLADLAQRRRALQTDVDALTAFVEEHRSRLRSELQRQLAELDTPNPDLEVPTAPEIQDVELDAPVHEPVRVPEPEPIDVDVAPAFVRAPSEEEVARAREDLLEALRRAGVDGLLDVESNGSVDAQAHVEAEAEPDAKGVLGAELLADADPVEEPEPGEPETAGPSDPGAEAAEPTPEVVDLREPESLPTPRLYDADADESGEIAVPDDAFEPTGAFDVLAEPDEDEPEEPVAVGATDDEHALDDLGKDTAGSARWQESTSPSADEDDPFLAELRRAVTDTEPLGPREDADLVDVHDHDDRVPAGRFRRRRSR